jgi:hypothetical protein
VDVEYKKITRSDTDPPENYNPDYPPQRIIDPEFQIKPEPITAVAEWKHEMRFMLRPNLGDITTKTKHYEKLLTDLSKIYELKKPELVVGFTVEDPTPGSTGHSNYNPMTHTITLLGKFSIITFLHEFAHARGYGEEFAVLFSNTVHSRVFLKSRVIAAEDSHLAILPEFRYEIDSPVRLSKVGKAWVENSSISPEEKTRLLNSKFIVKMQFRSVEPDQATLYGVHPAEKAYMIKYLDSDEQIYRPEPHLAKEYIGPTVSEATTPEPETPISQSKTGWHRQPHRHRKAYYKGRRNKLK